MSWQVLRSAAEFLAAKRAGKGPGVIALVTSRERKRRKDLKGIKHVFDAFGFLRLVASVDPVKSFHQAGEGGAPVKTYKAMQ